ncbi:uncharacterized protein F5Z01DRAFT_146930 [Emericellopsis atlantica]|uniref:Uncharacterized protein n=1 Tax=Emericellopsis atlantica TaxID=2614577 RepID=A0A9P7ZKB4_9HYPO|nr:uncharacterized protein F5Z01DRAFT_146930 [Emericellopsis atlantica]KAG9253570.1 hypothetical protein F5Z01DRAFT_146930 [Emericellopsis atlantica]
MIGTDAAGSATNQPSMVQVVPWDGSYPWRFSAVTVIMPNNDNFYIQISSPEAGDGNTLVGVIVHSYDATWLRCYSWHKKNVYRLPNGQSCASAFVCNHADGPVSQSKVTVKVSTNTDSATLDTVVSVDDVFGKIDYGNDKQVCDESWKDMPGTGCKIRARCHGNVPGLVEKMVSGLKDLARSKDAGMFSESTVRDKKWDPCKTGRDTCIGGWDWYDRPVTKVAQQLSVYVSDENGNDKGELSYELDCSMAKSCAGCDAAKFGMAVGSVFGGPFAILFGAGGLVTEAACASSGC